MPKHGHRSKRESGWLSLTTSLLTAGDTVVVSVNLDIPILQFSNTYNALEVYKVDFMPVVGTANCVGFLGSKTWAASTALSSDIAKDRSTIWTGTATAGIGLTVDLTDDLGNGVIFPAERIVFSLRSLAASAVTAVCIIRYRLKKVSDADLVTMLNQYLVV